MLSYKVLLLGPSDTILTLLLPALIAPSWSTFPTVSLLLSLSSGLSPLFFILPVSLLSLLELLHAPGLSCCPSPHLQSWFSPSVFLILCCDWTCPLMLQAQCSVLRHVVRGALLGLNFEANAKIKIHHLQRAFFFHLVAINEMTPSLLNCFYLAVPSLVMMVFTSVPSFWPMQQLLILKFTAPVSDFWLAGL